MSNAGIPLISPLAGVLGKLPFGSGLSGGTEEKSSASPIAEIAPPPPPPSPVTDDKDPVVAEKVNTAMEENEKKEVKTMRSRSATILTTGHGLLKGPTSARRTLMGS